MKRAAAAGPSAVRYAGYTTPAEFDAGYDNFITPEVVAHWEKVFQKASARVCADSPGMRQLRYGSSERNRIDFFPAPTAKGPAPLLLAIHGGLWFLFDKWFMHFLAPAFNAAGVHVACANYGLAPIHSLGEIVRDCRAAAAFLFRESAELSVDPRRISVLGHSAAGQLAAMVAAAPPFQIAGGRKHSIHALIGVSGFYDIEPFFHTHFQTFTRFVEEDYQTWNPLTNASLLFPRALLITGEKESDLLRQMAEHFGEALRNQTVSADIVVAPNECHFSVLHEVGRAGSELQERVLHQVVSA